MARHLRLGVNIDHVATLRNARGGTVPDPLRAARIAATAGANGITAHLREDRRHITDDDIRRLRRELVLPLNLEMAATEEMLAIALEVRPHAVCLVPERRQEVTTEGGLDVAAAGEPLRRCTGALGAAGVQVALFVDPDPVQLAAAASLGVPTVELHTSAYCAAPPGALREAELARLAAAAAEAERLGLECHAGHGLSYDTVRPVAAISAIVELNIGHFLVAEAIFTGLESAIRRMRALMDAARAAVAGP